MTPWAMPIRIALVIALCAVPAAIGSAVPAAPGAPPIHAPAFAIDRDSLRKALAADRAVAVDARRDPPTQERIPDALPLQALLDADGRVPAEARMLLRGRIPVVYCGSRRCDEAARAADRLRRAGLGTVLEYPEGWAGWSAP